MQHTVAAAAGGDAGGLGGEPWGAGSAGFHPPLGVVGPQWTHLTLVGRSVQETARYCAVSWNKTDNYSVHLSNWLVVVFTKCPGFVQIAETKLTTIIMYISHTGWLQVQEMAWCCAVSWNKTDNYCVDLSNWLVAVLRKQSGVVKIAETKLTTIVM